MGVALEVRRANWAAFVRRALDREKAGRGWSPAQIAAETARAGENSVSRATIFRWAKGDWVQAPEPEKVVAFCDVLGIPPSSAFAVLWPGKGERAAEPEPPPMDPDVYTVLRRLADPNTPDAEKYHIRETLRALAGRTIPRTA